MKQIILSLILSSIIISSGYFIGDIVEIKSEDKAIKHETVESFKDINIEFVKIGENNCLYNIEHEYCTVAMNTGGSSSRNYATIQSVDGNTSCIVISGGFHSPDGTTVIMNKCEQQSLDSESRKSFNHTN